MTATLARYQRPSSLDESEAPRSTTTVPLHAMLIEHAVASLGALRADLFALIGFEADEPDEHTRADREHGSYLAAYVRLILAVALDDLVAALDATERARGPLLDNASDALPADPLTSLARFGLTSREADVMLLVLEGLTNRQIAARLSVSPRTIEKHVERLLMKTCAPNRSALVALALRRREPLQRAAEEVGHQHDHRRPGRGQLGQAVPVHVMGSAPRGRSRPPRAGSGQARAGGG